MLILLKLSETTAVEAIIRELAQPIFALAGIDYKRVKVFIVDDGYVNAFVIDHDSVFVHLGLLRYSTKPYVLLGVLEHEIAHISAGHILQIIPNLNDYKNRILGSVLLGLFSAIVIGPQVASAVSLGGMTLSTKLFFDYSHDQESMADRYAIEYLNKSDYSNSGMKELFCHFKSLESDSSVQQYFLTLPLIEERLSVVRNYKTQNEIMEIPEDKSLKFARMVAKLDAFFSPVDKLSSKYRGDEQLLKYVNSIVYYRQGKIYQAIAEIDSLIIGSHNDPFLYELKAEMLLKAMRLTEVVNVYEESLKYCAYDLVKFSLSHTLLMNGDVEKAIFYLQQILDVDDNDALVWKYLGNAYRLNSNVPMHYFAMTRKAFIEGDEK